MYPYIKITLYRDYLVSGYIMLYRSSLYLGFLYGDSLYRDSLISKLHTYTQSYIETSYIETVLYGGTHRSPYVETVLTANNLTSRHLFSNEIHAVNRLINSSFIVFIYILNTLEVMNINLKENKFFK